MTRRRSTPTAWLALVAVLLLVCSGTSYAVGRAQRGDALIKKASLSGNRLRPGTVTGKQVKESTLGTVPRAATAGTAARVTQVGTTPLPLIAGWAAADNSNHPPTYGIDAQGWAHLEGAVTRTSGTAGLIGRLPPAARPTAVVYLPVFTLDGAGLVQIDTDGQVGLYVGSAALVSLEGLTFRTAAG